MPNISQATKFILPFFAVFLIKHMVLFGNVVELLDGGLIDPYAQAAGAGG